MNPLCNGNCFLCVLLGDIFIHAGDFTKCGRKEEVIEFNTWIGRFGFSSILLFVPVMSHVTGACIIY